MTIRCQKDGYKPVILSLIKKNLKKNYNYRWRFTFKQTDNNAIVRYKFYNNIAFEVATFGSINDLNNV